MGSLMFFMEAAEHYHFAPHWILVVYGVILYNFWNYWKATKEFDVDSSGDLDWGETLTYLRKRKMAIGWSLLLIPAGLWGAEPIYMVLSGFVNWLPPFKQVGDFAFVIMGVLPPILQIIISKFVTKK